MSDRIDDIRTGGPSEKPATRPRLPRRKAEKAAPSEAVEPRSTQRGKRADDAYTQVKASIRKELKPSLFFYLKQDAKTLSEIVEDFLEAYVEERGGIIGEKKPRRKK